MATNIMKYNNVSWNKEDLIACKQALNILLDQNASLDEIFKLEEEGAFGNLDINAALHEWDTVHDFTENM